MRFVGRSTFGLAALISAVLTLGTLGRRARRLLIAPEQASREESQILPQRIDFIQKFLAP